MKRIYPFLFFLFLFSCKKEREYTLEDFQEINGYWQITSVIYPDGEVKEYQGGRVIDYIELKGEKGFKKKLHPQLDGTYRTSDDAILFRLVKKADKGYFFSYNDSVNGWQEALNYMTDDYFAVKNQDGLVFCYYRQEEPNSIINGEARE